MNRPHGLRGPVRPRVRASISTRRRLASMSSSRRSGTRDPLAAGVVGDPEDGAHDHLERDRLHRRQARDASGPGPAREVALGDLGHHRAVVAHPLAVERRQQQPPVAQVLGAVEQQGRARPEDRRQGDVALAGVEQVRVAGEHLLDGDGVRGHDQHPVGLRQEREVIAAALPAGVEEPRRREHEADAHHVAAQVRAGRQPGRARRGDRRGGERLGSCLHRSEA